MNFIKASIVNKIPTKNIRPRDNKTSSKVDDFTNIIEFINHIEIEIINTPHDSIKLKKFSGIIKPNKHVDINRDAINNI